MTSTPTVALLGTGIMGQGMARNIAAAGLPLTVWNRTTDKAEPLSDVATVADSVGEAVAGADVVVTMLFDADSVADTLEQARDHLGEDVVWLQMSTVGVEGSDRLAALADDLGVELVDAPVLGTRQPAADGKLVVLGSGSESARAAVTPVLDAVGARTQWVSDEPGAGSRLKLVANAWVLTAVEGIAESLTLARELGVEPSQFLEAVGGGAMDAPYVQMKGKAMLADEHEAAFALNGAVKDAGLILEAAESVGLEMGLMPGVRAHLQRAMDAGHGDLDMSATYKEH